MIEEIKAKIAAGQSASIEDINPETAAYLMSLNTGNFRKLNVNTVDKYARDMRNGNWDLNGETIKISHGVVIDGQHRLAAIIKSGISVRTAVAFNLATDALNVDRGQARTVAQYLSHLGIKDSNNIASAAKLCFMNDLGYWDKKILQKQFFTDKDIVTYAVEHAEGLGSAVILARKSQRLVTLSMATAIVYLGSGKSLVPEADETVKWFWNGLATGENLSEKDAPFLLRARMIKEKLNEGSSISPPYQRWLITKMWNSVVQGKPVTKQSVRIRMTGPTKEPIPVRVLPVQESI